MLQFHYIKCIKNAPYCKGVITWIVTIFVILIFACSIDVILDLVLLQSLFKTILHFLSPYPQKHLYVLYQTACNTIHTVSSTFMCIQIHNCVLYCKSFKSHCLAQNKSVINRITSSSLFLLGLNSLPWTWIGLQVSHC